MTNPYIAGSWVGEKDFYGRSTILQTLLQETEKCSWVLGNRRMGKTSLLRLLENLTDAIPLYLNLQGTYGDPLRMGEDLANQVRRRARYDSRLGALTVTGRPLWEAITVLTQETVLRGHRILLMVDEAEELLTLHQEDLVALWDTLQTAPNLRTIMTATRRLLALGRTISDDSKLFTQECTVHYLPPLEEEATCALICQERNPDGAVSVDAILQGDIIRLTGHHPFLVQYLCSRLWQRNGSLRTITDYDAAVESSLADLLRLDFNALNVEQQLILGVLWKEERLAGPEICEKLMAPSRSLSDELNELVWLGWIRYDDGAFQVENEFARSWLRTQDSNNNDMEVRKLFTVGAPRSGSAFHDREDLLEMLLHPRHYSAIVIGTRGIGKTSLLKEIENRAHRGTFAVYFSAPEHDCTLSRLGSELVRCARNRLDPTNLRQKAGLRLDDDLPVVIGKLAASARATGGQVLLLLDNAEKLMSLAPEALAHLGRDLPDSAPFVRSILASRKELTYLFMEGFEKHYLGPLDQEDARAFVRQPKRLDAVSVEASDDLIEQILHVTGRHPYLINYLCGQLLMEENSTYKLGPIDSKTHVRVTKTLKLLFDSYEEDLSLDELNIIRELAKNDALTVSELKGRLSLHLDQLVSSLERLARLGFVRSQDYKYGLGNHFLRHWVFLSDNPSGDPLLPSLTTGGRQRLEAELLRLEKEYATFTLRIQSFATEIGRELSVTKRQILNEEREDWLKGREEIQNNILAIEKKLNM